MCADTGDLCCDEDIDGLEAPALASQSSSIASSSSAFAVFHPLPVAPPPLIGRSHSMVEASSALPPAPANLRRSSSVGSTAGLSSLYRDSTGRFYSAQQLHRRVDERGLAELAEVVGNMHRQDRALYALPHDYLVWLQEQTLLLAWRRGAVSWFSKVSQLVIQSHWTWWGLTGVVRVAGGGALQGEPRDHLDRAELPGPVAEQLRTFDSAPS
jgi:hypothetical protein